MLETMVLDLFPRRAADASVALVMAGPDKVSTDGIRGLITRQQIAGAVIDGMELFAA